MLRRAWWLLLVVSGAAWGQATESFPPPETAPTVRATRAEGKITVDGKLDEPDWVRAPLTEDFFRMEPRQGGAYRHRTSVRVLYDAKNLYVGVFARDSLGRRGIRMQDLRRDFRGGENDFFGVQLDPQNLKQYCVAFQATPYGSQRDLQNFNDNITDNDWNALWQVRTARTDSGYYAEFAIPFKTLRYERPAVGDSATWGVTFMRLARRDYEQTVFPAVPQAFSPYRMTYAAQLRGLELPRPSTNVRMEPYALYQYDRVVRNETDVELRPKVGGDIKWAVDPRTVVDLTFNTDFAQADIDRAVINLERFNIFFPEQRQFFLENSGIWAGASSRAIRPFFSRRIGLQGDFNAAPAPIVAGARYTQRTQRQTVAGLYMRQAETDLSASANFAVGRYARNYGQENNVGAMVTHRLDEPTAGQSSRQNTTLTVDGLVRPQDELTLTYMVSGSRDDTNDTLGMAGSLFGGYQTNNLYAGWLTRFVSSDYRPDMGFVFQRDVIRHNPGAYYIWRPKKLPWIRRWDPGVFADYYHDFSDLGNFQQASLYIFPVFIIFTDGSFLEYNIRPTWQNINFTFAPLGEVVPRGKYYYTRQQVDFYTNRSARLSGSVSVDWGRFYNGRRTSLTAGLRYAPSVHAALTVDYEYNDARDFGEDRVDIDTHLPSVGARFAFNPRTQLSIFYQYNSLEGRGRLNVRASWECRPLSFVYLVFNDTRSDDLDLPRQEQQVIAKATWTKQF